MNAPKGCVVAGTRSGCGKTSVMLGLLGALARRGLDVAPFKAGPDFIDPGHHAEALRLGGGRRPSHNLDTWMCPAEAVRGIFARGAAGADMALVEGVMGLFDGFSAEDEAGSTAHLAKLLGLPVILVADAASMGRSAAALVSGFARFDPGLRLLGVILNNVGSASHGDLVRRAVESALPGVPVLGCLPRSQGIGLASRHLGLVQAGQGPAPEAYARMADWAEAGLDLDGLVRALPAIDLARTDDPPLPQPLRRIGLARDAAFSFVYEENLRLLRRAGARIVEFSPLADAALPQDLDGLYIPGGYPELFAFDLAQNVRMRRAVAAFCASGRNVYAECGGFMYLTRSLRLADGRTFPMCGVFPAQTSMAERFAALGYREVSLRRATPLGPAGQVMRGHEFHYSSAGEGPGPAAAYAVAGRKGPLPDEGWLSGGTLGSYIHLHFASEPRAAACLAGAG